VNPQKASRICAERVRAKALAIIDDQGQVTVQELRGLVTTSDSVAGQSQAVVRMLKPLVEAGELVRTFERDRSLRRAPPRSVWRRR